MQHNNMVSNSETYDVKPNIVVQCQHKSVKKQQRKEYEQMEDVALTISVMLRHCVAGKLLPAASLISAARCSTQEPASQCVKKVKVQRACVCFAMTPIDVPQKVGCPC